jgi:hypothetical protein
VMKVYQPGGLGERQNTLQALTATHGNVHRSVHIVENAAATLLSR